MGSGHLFSLFFSVLLVAPSCDIPFILKNREESVSQLTHPGRTPGVTQNVIARRLFLFSRLFSINKGSAVATAATVTSAPGGAAAGGVVGPAGSQRRRVQS